MRVEPNKASSQQPRIEAPAHKALEPAAPTTQPTPAAEADRYRPSSRPQPAPVSQDQALGSLTQIRSKKQAAASPRVTTKDVALARKFLQKARETADPLAYLLQQKRPGESGDAPANAKSLQLAVGSLEPHDRKAFLDPTGPEAAKKLAAAADRGDGEAFLLHLNRAREIASRDLAQWKYKDADGSYYPEAAVSFEKDGSAFIPDETGNKRPLERVAAELRTTEADSALVAGSPFVAGAPRHLDPRDNDIKRLDNIGYSAGFNEYTKNPDWVAYRMFKIDQSQAGPRPREFLADQRTDAKVQPGDYDFAHTGFTRGHMAPNYNIGSRYGRDAQQEAFLMSNMVPQTEVLNGEVWRVLEEKIANDYAQNLDEVWVMVGPVYDAKKPAPGPTDPPGPPDPPEPPTTPAEALRINEVHASPGGRAADANRDGRLDGSQDEFVELRNTSSQPMDISGYTLADATGVRHTFPAGTIVPPGEAAVIFGGGRPTGDFGNASKNGLVSTASSGMLGLSKSDEVKLADPQGKTIQSSSYKSAPTGQSLVREGDGKDAGFKPHSQLGSLALSPGTRVDGQPFTDGVRPTAPEASDPGKPDELSRLKSGVAIPDSCFKIIVDQKDGEYRALAFIVGQNVKASDPSEKFLVSIDEIEARTGLDFLSELPDDIEERLEAQVASKMW